MVIRSISPEATSPELTNNKVRSVQPRTLQPPSLQLCLYIKTRITVILLQTLFLFKWNGFEISSSQDNYQIRQRINGEESKLLARQVDVTANSQRLSNPLYIGIKTWRTKVDTYTRPILSVQNVENKTSTTQRILTIVHILEFLSVQKNRVCSVSYCIVNISDCISSIQNLIQFFVIVKISLLELSLSIEVSFRCD